MTVERITPAQAVERLLAVPVSLKTETVPLAAACGRVLGADMTARLSVPPFDRSPFDGYALRGADTVNASREHPVTLSITEEIPAGTVPRYPVGPGQAAKILTGGPMPPGADTTVKYEQTEFGPDHVTIFSPCAPGSNVARAGEDVAAGGVLARRGDVLEPAALGLLAGQGFTEAPVYTRPAVTVLSTGSELLRPGQNWEPGKIYDSNTVYITALLRSRGVDAVDGGTVADDPDAISARLLEALEGSDMVITTGGASVGDYDWAQRAAEAIGGELLFRKFAQKPGGSTLAAVKDGKVLLSLSGNPGAAALALLRVGMPYIRKLCGRRDVLPETFRAVMARPYGKRTQMPRVLRGHLAFSGGQALFHHHEGDGNGILSSLAGCDALGLVPENSPPLAAGEMIEVLRL